MFLLSTSGADVADPVKARPAPARAGTPQRDAELVAAMARGDRDAALTAFYQRFGGLVLAVSLRILGRRAEAEELVQDVVVELWRRAPDYDPARAAVSTWVATIARSRALDALRARRRRQGEREVDVADVPLPAPLEGGPDAQAELGERQRAVHAALAGLSTEQRAVLELAFFEGLSHSEIAAKLGQPLGTVKSRILTAMRLLRGSVAAHAAGSGGDGGES